MLWSLLSQPQKTTLVTELQLGRHTRQVEVRKPRSTSKRKKVLKTSFKSKELQDLFNSLPPEMQRAVS